MRHLSLAERSVWGTCPTCGAKHNEKCRPVEGFNGLRLKGTHLTRLHSAPRSIPDQEGARMPVLQVA